MTDQILYLSIDAVTDNRIDSYVVVSETDYYYFGMWFVVMKGGRTKLYVIGLCIQWYLLYFPQIPVIVLIILDKSSNKQNQQLFTLTNTNIFHNSPFNPDLLPATFSINVFDFRWHHLN